MSDKKRCERCGERAETIDNIIGSAFWGALQREVETTEVKRVRILSTYYVRNERGENLMRTDEAQALCQECWGDFVGRFMQGRSIDALPGKEDQ